MSQPHVITNWMLSSKNINGPNGHSGQILALRFVILWEGLRGALGFSSSAYRGACKRAPLSGLVCSQRLPVSCLAGAKAYLKCYTWHSFGMTGICILDLLEEQQWKWLLEHWAFLIERSKMERRWEPNDLNCDPYLSKVSKYLHLGWKWRRIRRQVCGW